MCTCTHKKKKDRIVKDIEMEEYDNKSAYKEVI